jgi:FAD/FMN-containing dehydrogenase
MSGPSSFLDALAAIVGAAHVSGPGDVLSAACRPFFGSFDGRAEAIAYPGSAEEVRAIMALCRRMGKTIVPQGGNTGLVHGAQPNVAGDGLIVGFRRLNAITDLDRLNRSVVVGAGATIAGLNQALEKHGLRFAVSIGSEGSCQIGGIVSTNAGGHSVLRYGMTRHQLLGIEAVLADGRIVSNLRGLRKDNVGYDLAQLFCGAEGTLGLITAAALKLVPLPARRSAALLGFNSLEDVMDCYAEVSARSAEFLSAFELMSHQGRTMIARHFPDQAFPAIAESPWYVLMELEAAALGIDLDACLVDSLSGGAPGMVGSVVAGNEHQRRQFWASREALVFSQSREGPVLSHDVSVRVSRIPELVSVGIAAVRAISPEARVNLFGHVGDGNLHFNVIHPGPAPDFRREFGPRIERALYEAVASLGGSVSAEHGIGKKKREFVGYSRSEDEIAVMRDLKAALDPGRLLAPGNLLDS